MLDCRDRAKYRGEVKRRRSFVRRVVDFHQLDTRVKCKIKIKIMAESQANRNCRDSLTVPNVRNKNG